ncbi:MULTISPECIES: DUF624 domain-containing protein [unclassified Bacillus (in: firmicutes)]|uniref:DUF624 domain-containing protein n=1 Tax=unclassified Bacillus (in: firmicutes) TaxID=185979 RepID=UPI0004E21FC2|nr:MULTISPECIES: DUF624 domain-containing protein [unclassified Bacillus (in: firmicutes)]
MLSISKLVKKTGHQIFTNIMSVVFCSIAWSLFVVPVVFILPIPGAMVFLFLTFIPATVAVYSLMKRMLMHQRYKFGDFFRQFFYYFKRAFLFGILFWLAIIIPASSWWYYVTLNHGYMYFLFCIFQTYLCITFLISQVYTIPYLVMEDLHLLQAMNKSIKKFMSHTWYTIGFFMQILCIAILLSFTVIGFFLLFIGILTIFILNATDNIELSEREYGNQQTAK